MTNSVALIQVDPPSIIKIHKHQVRVKPGDLVGLMPGTAIVPVIQLDKPQFDHRTHSVEQASPSVFADRVEMGWLLVQRSDEQIVASIKRAASDVILSRFSEVSQRNMIADGLDLTATGDTSAEAQQKVSAYRAAFAWIKAVRAKSNELEESLVTSGVLPDFALLEVPYG